MKILIIAPHPDDEVLGCGGVIAKYSKRGDEVNLCIVTKAYRPDWSKKFLNNRTKEIDRAVKVLGIKKIFFLNLPTVKVDTVPQKKLNKLILEIIYKVRPAIIYLPHGGDINKDHRLVFEAALVALRPRSKTSVKKVLCYETLSETAEGVRLKEFIPSVYEDISSDFDKKIQAMRAYQSEIRKFPHPRSLKMIEVLAQSRGSEAGFRLAEAFMLIREIIN